MNTTSFSVLTTTFALALSSLSCRSRPEPDTSQPPAPMETPRPVPSVSPALRSRVEQTGRASDGTLVFLRQIHPNRYLGTAPVSEMRNVALYQLEIWRELERRRPVEVLKEGYTEDMPPETLRAPDTRDPFNANTTLHRIRSAFPRGLPSQNELNDEQVRLLYTSGGSLIYGSMHANVTLRKTLTPQEDAAIRRDETVIVRSVTSHLQEDILRRIQEGSMAIPTGELSVDPREFFNASERQAYREITHTRRNFYAMREARRVLERRPGEDVVIVFGALHNFCEANRQMGWAPATTSLWWTGGLWVDASELPPTCS